jgi:hypothetical protein
VCVLGSQSCVVHVRLLGEWRPCGPNREKSTPGTKFRLCNILIGEIWSEVGSMSVGGSVPKAILYLAYICSRAALEWDDIVLPMDVYKVGQTYIGPGI